MIHVALVNRSTVVKNNDCRALAVALTEQAKHLGVAGYDVVADCVYTEAPGSAGRWQLVILDDSDQADALGYHETTVTNQPIGKVFARTDRDAGLNWTVTASHEFVEMLVDPWALLAVDLGGGDWVAWEACDPCEADVYGYRIGTVLVSDFVTPAWFVPGPPGPYDWKRHIRRPLSLLPGGYAAVQQRGVWTQKVAREASPDGVSRVVHARRIERRRRRGAHMLNDRGAA
jgi:hypothetical protein